MTMIGQDTLKTRRTLDVNGKSYDYFSLEAAGETIGDVSRLPYSLKVLLENLLRHEDGRTVSTDDVKALAQWLQDRRSDREIAYRPARVLMQDFTGVPAVVDLAAMRDAVRNLDADPNLINPLSPVDLVIDHSVMVDYFASEDAFEKNVDLEYERNGERYEFLRWGQTAFDNFRVVPPGTGICHQVNLEYLAQTVWTSDNDGKTIAYPDTLVGTDSHTTMVNGLGVLGWGVGGIEAEAAMLGQPISMVVPEVVGFKLTGQLREGMTATDLVLTVTQMLRAKGVVGKFVEFYGDGLDHLTLADQATISNMAPEYGATCGIFPVDEETLRYMRFTGRSEERIALVEAYAKAQGMWRDAGSPDPVFTDTLELDLSKVEPSLAGPKRPQDRVPLSQAAASFRELLGESGDVEKDKSLRATDMAQEGPAGEIQDGMVSTQDVNGADHTLSDGDVVIAAITSCTNTSNPSVLIGAGLVARKARELGLTSKPWVKTSLAPGSQVVTEYLEKSGLQDDLDAMGFNLVGYGCTTCIGNSGPLPEEISEAIHAGDLNVVSVLSGNRNFEGRIGPDIKSNYLASPPLVVAYAIAGSMLQDIYEDPLGKDKDGNDVYLKDIWPTNKEINDLIESSLSREMFESRYGDVFKGDKQWQDIKITTGQTYEWNDGSTYVRHPSFFEDMEPEPAPLTDIKDARMLAMLADSVTTDHISPAGSIKEDGPAGEYLKEHQVRPIDFNSYGSRRGNHEVMMRGTFANIRIRNEMAPGTEGGVTIHYPSGEEMSIYDAAMRYQEDDVQLVVVGGKEYGTGSSRDWAAKGTRLLGVRAAIVESFERIHRSNLVGMGVLPLQFLEGTDRKTLELTGKEVFDISGIADGLKPRSNLRCTITYDDGSTKEIELLCRIDTLDEIEYYRNGGILQYVLRNMLAAA
ncbi:MAG: aconitate hydratase AcnA [Alphaproteobacteria bacterium]|nr:aconitate hydratase AcnA [Alphaproteobacteria bacterium]